MKPTNISIYIHIPFCLSKCSYCSFVSSSGWGLTDQSNYIDLLEKEIELFLYNNETFHPEDIHTIFIGGGTPTSLSESLMEKLLSMLDRFFSLKKNQRGLEYTVEANPRTITKEKAEIMSKYGVNRISLGLQSAHPKELASLGRTHSFEDAAESMEILRSSGIDNINLDLMYAIPGQTPDSFHQSLIKVLALKPYHISTYSLILEEDTPLYGRQQRQEITLPTEDEDLLMYESAIDLLEQKGYFQYEISNFSIPGKECQHNMVYWRSEEYIGFGLSAHSFYQGIRYSNQENMTDYQEAIQKKRLPHVEREVIDSESLFEEWIFLRLRMKQGISIPEINKKFSMDFISKYEIILNKLENEGLIIYNPNTLRLTTKGFELSNYVFLSILV